MKLDSSSECVPEIFPVDTGDNKMLNLTSTKKKDKRKREPQQKNETRRQKRISSVEEHRCRRFVSGRQIICLI